METNKICQNCGRQFITKNKNAKFCSTSCRVSNYQKQKRKKDKKPIKKFQLWINKNISKTVVWFFLVLLFFFTVPTIFEKTIKIYKNCRVEWQNEKLIKQDSIMINLQTEIRNLSNKKRVIEENKEMKIFLKILLKEKNGWMDKSSISQFINIIKKRNRDLFDELTQKSK